jgi:hypothetical protein
MELTSKLFVFFSCVIIFSILYYFSGNKISYTDSLLLSTSFQTFNGIDVMDFNQSLKIMSIVQMIFSYTFIVIVLYSFSK